MTVPRERTLGQQWHYALVKAGSVACYAAIARIVFGILKVLVRRMLGPGTLKALADEVITMNPIKWGALLGAWSFFPVLRNTIQHVAESWGVSSACARSVLSSVASGVVVSQSVRVMELSTVTELALYLFVRSVHARTVVHALPRAPQAFQQFRHFDSIAMGIAGGQILYAILFAPASHSPAYMAFLQRCTMMTRDTCDSIAAFHRGHVTPAVVRTTSGASVECMAQSCNFSHIKQGESCIGNLLRWGALHMVRFSFPVYVPLKISTTLMFQSKLLASKPVQTAISMASGIVSSSLFLTTYCGGAFAFLCLCAQNNIRGGWKVGSMVVLSCAVTPFLEPKSRRLDLALYCSMHALRSWWLTLYHRGYVPRPTAALVHGLYTIALTSLLDQLVTQPDTLNSKLRSGLSMIVPK